MMNKRGQLGAIEFKFFMYGFIVGIILGIALVSLSCNGVLSQYGIPKVAALCG